MQGCLNLLTFMDCTKDHIPIGRQKVIVIGHSTTLRLGMVRAVAELGCDISIIVIGARRKLIPLNPFDLYSKHISRIYFSQPSEEELIKVLLEQCTDPNQKIILLPGSDFSALVIDNNKAVLSKYFLFPHIANSEQSVGYWMCKENQKQLARVIGLNVPNAHTVDIRNGAYAIPEGIDYPCFTKPVVSVVGGKDCFRRCNDRDELCRMLDTVAAIRDAVILVEDYKEIETEYAVLGFSDGREVVIPGVIHLTQQTISHFGVAMTGKVIPVTGFEELLEQFKRYVLEMGFVGVFDIDFYYSEGVFYFGEMNLRPGGSGYAVTKLGVNLPAMLIRHLRGENGGGYDRRAQITHTASFVNERMCEDDWYVGNISLREYHKIISSADISFVKDENDPKPQKVFGLWHFIHQVKSFIKKIVRRR